MTKTLDGRTLGRFKIIGRLGEGGMGEVYRARDEQLGREVALKVIKGKLNEDPGAQARFEREAKAVAALNHPNILALHDYGREGGLAYAVMELLEGETLQDRLKRGPLPVGEALEVAAQIVRGMAAAHAKGIVHRDLKPANIFLTREGPVKILDFSLAWMGDPMTPAGEFQWEGPTVEAHTRPGTVMGTIGYMSPEQARGLPVDARSDIFAFGAVLYEMLAGTMAFKGGTATDILASILLKNPEPLPAGTPPALDRLVRKCLEKRPEDRPPAAPNLGLALEVVAVGAAPVEAPPASDSPASSPRSWRRGVAAAAALLAVLTAGWMLLRGNGGPRPAEAAAGPPPSIAVLPLENLSGDQEQEYFSDGLTEELIALLTKIDGLHVAGRTSSFAFKGKNTGLTVVGRALNVATVLDGSVRRSGDRLRISVQLVNIADGYQLWAETFDRGMTDVFVMQDEIAGAVVAALRVKLLPGKGAGGGGRRTANPEAHTQVLLGRQAERDGNADGWSRAVEAYEAAIRLDPGYAQAYAGLALAQMNMAWSAETPAEAAEWDRRGRSTAEKAIALDPAMAAGYSVRAYIRIQAFPPDWAGAEADYARALELNPGDADTRVSFGMLLYNVGRIPEAVAAMEKACALDPLSPRVWRVLGSYHLAVGDLPAARQALMRALEIRPGDTMSRLVLGWTELLEGRPQEALIRFEEVPAHFRLMGTALARHALGDGEASQRALDELIARLGGLAAYQIAEVYAWRGGNDQAFEWLDRAYAQKDPGLCTLRWSPFLARLRSDPRYPELLHRLNFPAGLSATGRLP